MTKAPDTVSDTKRPLNKANDTAPQPGEGVYLRAMMPEGAP